MSKFILEKLEERKYIDELLEQDITLSMDPEKSSKSHSKRRRIISKTFEIKNPKVIKKNSKVPNRKKIISRYYRPSSVEDKRPIRNKKFIGRRAIFRSEGKNQKQKFENNFLSFDYSKNLTKEKSLSISKKSNSINLKNLLIVKSKIPLHNSKEKIQK